MFGALDFVSVALAPKDKFKSRGLHGYLCCPLDVWGAYPLNTIFFMSERPGHKSPHIVGYVRNQYPWGARPSTDIRMVNWSELQQMTLYVQPNLS